MEPKARQKSQRRQAFQDDDTKKHCFSKKLCNKWNNVALIVNFDMSGLQRKPYFFLGFLHILLRASAPGSAYGGCPKALVFTTKKARFPSPGPPKSTQNRPQTHKNAKVEAKSRRKAISEALEIDFGPQDSDFGGHKSDFGGQNGPNLFWIRTFEVAQRNAQGL